MHPRIAVDVGGFFIFVPFYLILSHFGPHALGLVPKEEGVLSLEHAVIFNVIATEAGTSTSAQRGSRLRGNDEKGRSESSTFNLTTAPRPGQTRRSAPTVGVSEPGQTRRSAHTMGGLPSFGFMTWRTSGPRAGTGRVWAWGRAVPAGAGGRICSPRPRGAGPAACAGVRGCLPAP